MAKCNNCGRPLIISGGKCIYCGKTPNGQILQTDHKPQNIKFPPIKVFNINGVSLKMIFIEGGTFWMGAQADNPQGQNYDHEAGWVLADGSGEFPVHKVTLSSFYIGETVITQSLWKAVGRKEAISHEGWSNGKGDNLPAYNIRWNEANSFIYSLNKSTGQKFRMPTEAEWEFAARGGNKSRNTKYAGSNNLDDVGWYWKNSGDKYLLGETMYDIDPRKMKENNCKVHAVKEKLPNELGLYDMSGNVWEWCQDIYGKYESRHQFDPWGPYSSGSEDSYIIRGGGWYCEGRYCRVTQRNSEWPHDNFLGKNKFISLRLCLPC